MFPQSFAYSLYFECKYEKRISGYEIFETVAVYFSCWWAIAKKTWWTKTELSALYVDTNDPWNRVFAKRFCLIFREREQCDIATRFIESTWKSIPAGLVVHTWTFVFQIWSFNFAIWNSICELQPAGVSEIEDRARIRGNEIQDSLSTIQNFNEHLDTCTCSFSNNFF